MAYATGKYAKFISDRSGMEYPYTEMVVEWNGARVHKSEFEPKTPQDRPNKHMPDAISLQYPRPARVEPATERLLPKNPFSIGANTAIVVVTEPGHGRSTGDTVRFRNVQGRQNIIVSDLTIESSSGHTITKVDDDSYNFTIGGGFIGLGLHGQPDIRFGGEIASSGPVTVSN